jgi:hypothetical protein
MQSSVFGSFGAQPEDVLRTEFFAFFHLTETGRSELGDGRTSVVYRSPAPQFHDLTWVDVVADGDGTARLALSMVERFIMDPTLAVYGKDIAKSFIGDGIASNKDRDVLMPIARDIAYRQIPGTAPSLTKPASADDLRDQLTRALDLGKPVTVMLGGGPDNGPPLPEIYTRGYAVYLGERPSYTAELAMTRFSMRNETADGGRLLTIAFDRRA